MKNQKSIVIEVTNSCSQCDETWVDDFLNESDILEYSHALKGEPKLPKAFWALRSMMHDLPGSNMTFVIPLEYKISGKSDRHPAIRFEYPTHLNCDRRVIVTVNSRATYKEKKDEKLSILVLSLYKLQDHDIPQIECSKEICMHQRRRDKTRKDIMFLSSTDEKPSPQTTSQLTLRFSFRDSTTEIYDCVSVLTVPVYGPILEQMEIEMLELIAQTCLCDIAIHETGSEVKFEVESITKYIPISGQGMHGLFPLPYEMRGQREKKVNNKIVLMKFNLSDTSTSSFLPVVLMREFLGPILLTNNHEIDNNDDTDEEQSEDPS